MSIPIISSLSSFPLQNQQIFQQVVKDVFSGLPTPPPMSLRALSAHSRSQDIEQALEATAQETGLIPHKPWIEKTVQLYNIAQVHQGESTVKITPGL